MQLARVLSVAVILCACRGEAAPAVVQEEIRYPTCDTPGLFLLEGELNGKAVAVRRSNTDYQFSIGELEINIGVAADIKVMLYHDEMLGHGDEVPAYGAVENVTGFAAVSNCSREAWTGKLRQSADGRTYQFVLRGLAIPPGCGGTPVTGELRGCLMKPRE